MAALAGSSRQRRLLDDQALQQALATHQGSRAALARQLGILVGTSAGANVWASMEVAKTCAPDQRIVTILPDRVERYFSTALI